MHFSCYVKDGGDWSECVHHNRYSTKILGLNQVWYDLEKPQSETAAQPMASIGRDTEQTTTRHQEHI